MDVKMQGMDGEQVTRAIRSDATLRHVSILLLCEHPRPTTRQSCLDAGASDFLSKPFRSADLLTRVRQLLEVAPRKSTKLLAHIELQQGAPVERIVARILNVSTTGMLLETDIPLEIGRDLVVKFFVPGNHAQLQASARVVRRADSHGALRSGIRFTKVDDATRRVLTAYVNK
jgi:response regulator RpfG family c-di-GMP phosphodiesterase